MMSLLLVSFFHVAIKSSLQFLLNVVILLSSLLRSLKKQGEGPHAGASKVWVWV